jgi:hypothetical protein
MKRLAPLVVLALALAACKTVPPPEPVIQHVFVPEPVACVAPGEIPAEPPTVGQRFNGDAKHDLAILAPSAQALRKWGQDMRALLERCAAAGIPSDEAETEPDPSDG